MGYFSGSVVVATYTGQQIYAVLGEQFAPQSRRLLVSGLKYTWSGVVGQSPQPTIVEVRAADGTPLDKAKNYTVATNSALTGDIHTTFPTIQKGANLATIPNADGPAALLAYLPTLPQPIVAPTLDRVTLQASP
jgi:2',3'-cyclic-nucleotide 2'-phosphodiesterase (5'-nucleotidase family)